jgi:ribosome-associated toxin RatA of RatAB toxin-antitoxin module
VEINLTINLPTTPEKLFEVAIDYENYVNYLPQQIKKITIIEEKENETTIEETLAFMTILKKEITQTSIHRKKPNMITTEIISGPFANSTIVVNFEKDDDGTSVKVKANFMIPAKYKIFSLVVKKVYKNYIKSILYKMMNEIE